MSIFLAVPNSGFVDHSSVISLIRPTKLGCRIFLHCTSFLTDGFNECLAQCLNTEGIQYFAMHHSDISTEPFWVDTLIGELQKNKLDIISTVLPIKDDTGAVSTAVRQDDGTVQRLTLTETLSLPVTFTADDLPKIGKKGVLLVNTGLWVAPIAAWMKEFEGFDAISRIVFQDGKYSTLCSPEDWSLSAWMAEHSLKVGATHILKAEHWGKKCWRNYSGERES